MGTIFKSKAIQGKLRILVGLAVVFLLCLSFWFGRTTAREGRDNESSHQETSSTAVKSKPETVPHGHEEGKPDNHIDGKVGIGGLILSSEEKSNIGLKTVVADLRPVEMIVRAAGLIKPHTDREAQVSSRVPGRIGKLFFNVGDAVQKGQRLAEIQSVEIQRLQVDLIQAENRRALAKAELDRIQRLVESKIAAQKEFFAAKNQYQAVLNEIGGLTQQLVLLGLPEDSVKRVRAEKTVSTFAILSPISGVVAERNVVLGEAVEPSKVIFRVLDLSIVYVEGNVFEEALPHLKIRQRVRIRLASYPGEVFTGRISRFSPTIDPEKRTLHLWAEVPNRTGKLKPNLFAEMDVVVGEGREEVLAVPLEAVIRIEGKSFVFVEEKGSFRRADLILGARDDRYVEVKSGLFPGDQVVTDGKQQVYTKSLMTRQGGVALGGHGH
jgi:cobalt-zinc-cadmium efflux system membrane fusion protein